MKRLLVLAAACCCFALCISCQEDVGTDDDNVVMNPVAGTSWEWSEPPITWTFTFSEDEVTFDYRAEFSSADITIDQYKAPYTYTSNTVTFNMNGWSGIEWKYTGTIVGDEMTLVDSGTEQINIVLKKK